MNILMMLDHESMDELRLMRALDVFNCHMLVLFRSYQ
jgi:hypothetical protein